MMVLHFSLAEFLGSRLRLLLYIVVLHKSKFDNSTKRKLDKLKLIGRNLGRVFNFKFGHVCLCLAIALITKTALLKVENSA